MNRIFLIPSMVIAFFMVGCAGNQSDDHAVHEHTSVSHSEEDHVAEVAPLSEEVLLDNGKKWVANRETTEGIDQMLAAVKTEESKEQPDYEALKESLDKEFAIVLEKCTMKGESHDQLHNYLLPLKARFGKLNPDASHETMEDLQKYLSSYYDYFN